jgi:arylsulfatase A-like enzyme
VRRPIAVAALASVALATTLVSVPGARAAPPPPNVVVIISDDQRAELIDRMPIVRSELVQKGMSFDQAFAVDPLCCPSRTSFLRGQYSHTTGTYNVQYDFGGFHYVHAQRLENETLPVWLHRDGYFTAEAGKYLNGYNDASWIPPGWDFWRGMLAPGYSPGSWSVSVQGTKQTPNAYSSDAVADYAVQGIAASGTQPLFLWAAFYGPHNPSTPPPRYATDAQAPECADLDVATLPGFNEAKTDTVDGMHDKPRWLSSHQPFSDQTIAKERSDYKDQCRSDLAVDDGVGRILAALEAKDPGLENTIVVYTSDQGVQDGVHAVPWKKVPYDGSSQLPFVVRDDALLGGRPSTNDDLILNIDLAPTILALTGATGRPDCPSGPNVYATACRAHGGGFDGVSFAPLLWGDPYNPRDDFLIEHWDPVTISNKVPMYCAVRTKTGFLARYFDDAAAGPDWEGYDLTTDPNMLHSLVYSGSDGVARFRAGGAALYAALEFKLADLCRPGPPDYPPLPPPPPSQTLTLDTSGAGTGTVTSAPDGLTCQTGCERPFLQDAVVTLTATPDDGSTFVGWSGGGCSGADECVLSMDADHEVTATFRHVSHTLDLVVSGPGTVVDGDDLDCGGGDPDTGSCDAAYSDDTAVHLVAIPDDGQGITSWTGGGCAGTSSSCDLHLDADQIVSVRFAPSRTLDVDVEGDGRVTSPTDDRIDCPEACEAEVGAGAVVVLHAQADPDRALAGWSSSDPGVNCAPTDDDCAVRMDQALTVSAIFVPGSTLTVRPAGDGAGLVTTSAGTIHCGDACSDVIPTGTTVRLHAAAETGSTFMGWMAPGVDCPGTGDCTVTLDRDLSVTANFYAPNIITLADADPTIQYDGWTAVADGVDDGGFDRASATTGATLTWTSRKTTSLTVVCGTGPDGGNATVAVDGGKPRTIDLYAASAGFLNTAFTGLKLATHTVVIKVLGTKDAVSSGRMVRLDSIETDDDVVRATNPAIVYDTWKSTSQNSATDGTYRSATNASASVAVVFSGTSITWITAKGKPYGQAAVSIDGVPKGTVDLYRASTTWDVAVRYTGLTAGFHRIVITVLGKKNAHATNTRVVIDGFVAQS